MKCEQRNKNLARQASTTAEHIHKNKLKLKEAVKHLTEDEFGEWVRPQLMIAHKPWSILLTYAQYNIYFSSAKYLLLYKNINTINYL